jgi:hypothetical protein
MEFELRFSSQVRLNVEELALIRLALNNSIYLHGKYFDIRWMQIREKLYQIERPLSDIERNFKRSNWGGEKIYTKGYEPHGKSNN